MGELVIRPDRVPGVVITAVFAVLFASSFWALFVRQWPADVGMFLIAVVCQAVFGAFVALGLRRIFTPSLRLTREGFAIGTAKVAWADIDDIEIVKVRSQGIPLPDRIRIVYAPGLRRSWIDVALGSIGLGRTPTYLYATFYDMRGGYLYETLRRWWGRYRDA
jgi:hypothetical protein